MYIHPILLLGLLALTGGFVFYMLLPMVTSRYFPAKLKRKLVELRLWWNWVTRYGTELGGYVHDDGFTQWVPPHMMSGTVATWAIAAGAVTNSVVFGCDATDEVAVLTIPVLAPSNSGVDVSGAAVKGALLKSIEIDFEILTAALDAMSATIYKMKRGADGAVVVVSTPSFTYDAGHDSAAERIDVDQHKMTLTLDTAVYIENDEYYYVKISFDKAATSTVEVLGAFINYTLKA